MLAKIADALPAEPGFLFEPKWDGFRTIVFRTAEQTLLQSRDCKSLNRSFPELEQALHDALPKGCVLAAPAHCTSTATRSTCNPCAPRASARRLAIAIVAQAAIAIARSLQPPTVALAAVTSL